MRAADAVHHLRRVVLGFAGTSVVLLVAAGGQVEGPVSAKPAALGSVPWLIEKHDCWTGEAPADVQGQLPGHVVVTRPGDEAPTYGGSDAVARALAHVFDGKHPDLVVHAFCR